MSHPCPFSVGQLMALYAIVHVRGDHPTLAALILDAQRRTAAVRVGGGMKTCSFDGCDRPHSAHGWCQAHYQQGKRGQELRPLKVTYTVCTLDGCDRPHSGRLPRRDGVRRMTEPHNCPFTLGQLMALHAITKVAGFERHATKLLHYAEQHTLAIDFRPHESNTNLRNHDHHGSH